MAATFSVDETNSKAKTKVLDRSDAICLIFLVAMIIWSGPGIWPFGDGHGAEGYRFIVVANGSLGLVASLTIRCRMRFRAN